MAITYGAACHNKISSSPFAWTASERRQLGLPALPAPGAPAPLAVATPMRKRSAPEARTTPAKRICLLGRSGSVTPIACGIPADIQTNMLMTESVVVSVSQLFDVAKSQQAMALMELELHDILDQVFG